MQSDVCVCKYWFLYPVSFAGHVVGCISIGQQQVTYRVFPSNFPLEQKHWYYVFDYISVMYYYLICC